MDWVPGVMKRGGERVKIREMAKVESRNREIAGGRERDLKCIEEKHEEERGLTAGSDEENRCLKNDVRTRSHCLENKSVLLQSVQTEC